MKFDVRSVIKSGLKSTAASIPALASWVQLCDEHEMEELNRMVDRFWEAFKFEVGDTTQRFEEMTQSVDHVRESIALLERTVSGMPFDISADKQQTMGRLVAKAMVDNDISRESRIAIIDYANELTEPDIEVLRRFNPGQSLQVNEIPGAEDDAGLGELVVSLARLEARGIIGQTSSYQLIECPTTVGDPATWRNDWRNRWYELLPVGRQFLFLLS